ncbi:MULTISPECIES: FoF1 ATP synthase subunit B' [Campylobacter]|uniref:ATP synthase subunit b n=1 Tax=Campylobacter taeniopygiae TaxID=2510188 RepID=A0ABY2TJN2_9BACT|nr:FoF1 ATP synthase subunit B' [Campylobacter taeniopygiae]MBZ7936078.1 F0F1 ATP synthase subunit B' [Campylobacter sp. B0100352/1]MBZ7963993.1 F0F1 ATP synthase subunit B' [Campylobacter sp. 2457A]TKX33775.1 F0F1 ATP synthase subunit B' [Campylobacter taeniopygiae]
MFEDMHPSIMFATMAIFLAMIVILNTMLYKPLLKSIDERNDSIKNDENKAKQYSQDISSANDEVEAIYANAREEVFKIKQQAINAAKEEAEQVVKAKKEELERRMSNFYLELENQKKEFKANLDQYLPDLKQTLQNNIKKIGIKE